MTDKAFVIEAQLLRWGDNNASGRTVTFQLPELPGDHPFKGYPSGTKNGQRVALSVALIADNEAVTEPKEEKPKRQYTRSQRAAMLCGDAMFQKFLGSQWKVEGGEYAAAEFMRGYCDVASRSELDAPDDSEPVKKYNQLMRLFELWKNPQ